MVSKSDGEILGNYCNLSPTLFWFIIIYIISSYYEYDFALFHYIGYHFVLLACILNYIVLSLL